MNELIQAFLVESSTLTYDEAVELAEDFVFAAEEARQELEYLDRDYRGYRRDLASMYRVYGDDVD